MSGIVSYFHGESGEVLGSWWGLFGETLGYQIDLAGDPLRTLASDIGADIGIDPAIAAGDRAVYLRLDGTTGLWVRWADRHGQDLGGAIERARAQRRWFDRWRAAQGQTEARLRVAGDLVRDSGEAIRIVEGGWAPPPAPTETRFFLSYSSTDSLLARQVHEELRRDAKVNLWFDLAQPRRSAPRHEREVAAWLRRSVRSCQGLVLVLSAHALASGWVRREWTYAVRGRRRGSRLRIIVLKADASVVPAEMSRRARVIDLAGLWWSRGLGEELLAAVHDYEGRCRWLAAEPGWPAASGGVRAYDDYGTEAGTVRSFHWSASAAASPTWCSRDLRWSLEFARRDGESVRVEGRGPSQPVDLGLRRGHRVAFLRLHSRWGVSLGVGLPLWMRSADLDVTPDVVLDRYFVELGLDSGMRAQGYRIAPLGFDTWGRVLAQPEVQLSDGQWRRLDELEWGLLRRGVAAKAVLERLLEDVSTRQAPSRPRPSGDP